jgi:NADH-quinone oxidoreductase subunit L
MKQRRSLSLGLLAALALLAVPLTAWAQEGHVGEAGANVYAPLVPLVIFFPLIGLLINVVAGRRLGEPWAGIVASFFSGLAFLIAVLQADGLARSGYAAVTVPLFDWIVIKDMVGNGSVSLPWAFQVDTLSVTMMLVVTGVGTLIHIFAIGYMHGDVRVNGDPARFPRFFVYLNLFLVMMLILVTGDSYLTMFVGWEGVGLCSYLLIGFWFEKGAHRIGNARAARKAFVVNRVGDWALMMAMFMIFWMFGSFTYNDVFARLETVRLSVQGQIMITVITLLLLAGAAGKSAQIPLYVWLPDAMAGPTPVSALIHAATMVTAGIYMITRSHPLYALTPESMQVVAWVGAATALFAATIAVAQTDIKRVLAYSTISQLGFMVTAVGLGGYVAGMFHLVTHAFFKALLFLSSGSVIHAMEEGHHALVHAAHATHIGGGGDEHSHGDAQHGEAQAEHRVEAAAHDDAHAFDPQDMRNMGGLWDKLPVTKWVYLIGALALAGIAPFAGFWSKDEILLDAFTHNPTIYWVLTIAAFFTAFYMGRQILMVFFGKPRSEAAAHAVESPPVMTIPLVVLAFLSLWGGVLNLPTIGAFDPIPSVATPWGAHGMTNWLNHTLAPGEAEAHGAEGAEELSAEAAGPKEGELNLQVAGTSTGLAVLAILLSYAVYRSRPKAADERDPLQGLIGPVFVWLRNKWYVDEIYDFLILRPFNWLSVFLADVLDWKVWHDWFHDKVLLGLFNTFARLLAEGVDLGGIDAVANGLGEFARTVAASFRNLQRGYVRAYALMMFIGAVVVLGYFLLVR